MPASPNEVPFIKPYVHLPQTGTASGPAEPVVAPWLAGDPRSTLLDEHDACAIVAGIRKGGTATHGNLKRVLNALSKMGHRSGDVNGEGDGCGVLTDIPRTIWAEVLRAAGKPVWLAEDARFFVGHFMLPRVKAHQRQELVHQIEQLFYKQGMDLLVSREGLTRSVALGRLGQEQEPIFWQVAGMVSHGPIELVEGRLFRLIPRVEQLGVHVASLSSHTVVYKVRGTVETLYHYYPELRSPQYTTAITLGHTRYSTNTTTVFERVQPFHFLGHNGEINTIARLREQAQMVGAQLVVNGSDSQDLDRALGTLVYVYGYSLIEAMELLLPPILTEVAKMSTDAQAVYQRYRYAFGPFAQGPAGLIARCGDTCAFSVDALGLRPLWFGETEKEYFFSSEKGVYYLDSYSKNPHPLSPGEKMVVCINRSADPHATGERSAVRVMQYYEVQQAFVQAGLRRFGKDAEIISYEDSFYGERASHLAAAGAAGALVRPSLPSGVTLPRLLAAMGWGREDVDWVKDLAENGSDPLGSLGYDGPLAALGLNHGVAQRLNIADYFKESVAVVTNPAIDREREKEHFSTQVVLGRRPTLAMSTSLGAGYSASAVSTLALGDEYIASALGSQAGKGPTGGASDQKVAGVALDLPVLLEAGLETPFFGPSPEGVTKLRAIAKKAGVMCLEDAMSLFGADAVRLDLGVEPGESLPDALNRLAEAAIQAVMRGARLVLLDDGGMWAVSTPLVSTPLGGKLGWLDPLLAVAVIDRALRMTSAGRQPWQAPQPLAVDQAGRVDFSTLFGDEVDGNLRRQAGLVLRSGAIRQLHDLVMALGLGADAVSPYLLVEAALDDPQRQGPEADRELHLLNLLKALRAGLEKVTSTMGIHELRGYGRLFSSVGLSEPLALAMGTINYFGSETRGLTWEDLREDAAARAAICSGEARPDLNREHRFYPKVWKAAGQVAQGLAVTGHFETQAEALSQKQPVTLRHVLDFRFPAESPVVDYAAVDAGLTGHALPFVIASMSFGSQGEVAFRAYAEAAYRLNMLSLNGEGGEIQDMMGKYPHHRGQQIASGRFGVNIDLLNSSNLLEIKVGQGAKPGEGGHLPGRKVSEKVAAARHARKGVDLISPSNNHDIYSIEDLAQFIEELKTANPRARIAVKVPVVPGIGVIAMGIAKAGADIINLAGYDGGTGAARKHALKHVGLPAEIGVVEAHRALTEAGLRHRVELWCDGGMRTAADVVKMLCLGANRVGFGTLAMVAIGCTICRACQKDTCHVGIATQIENQAQAEAHGLKKFEPQDFERATQSLVSFFGALGDQVRRLTAQLGFSRTQDLVGRTDLLQQVACHDSLDLTEMLLDAQRAGRSPLGAGYSAAEQMPQALHLSTGIQLRQHPLRRPRNHLTTVISNMVMETAASGEEIILFEDDKVSPVDRALGTHLAGALARHSYDWDWAPGHGGVGGLPVGAGGEYTAWRNGKNGKGDAHSHEGAGRSSSPRAHLRFYDSSVPGNGLGAYGAASLSISVEGSAQDGVGKGLFGGRIVILKGYNHDGARVGGSVGKGLAYGAIAGLIIVQGNADSRACIRLSGADVVLAGEIRRPIQDELGYLGARSNIKGFLCEYMTAGRVLVLGDPGPWMCAGMTGGVLYLRLQPDFGFDLAAIHRRIAQGANVRVLPVDEQDEENLRFLMGEYIDELQRSHQTEEAYRMQALAADWRSVFVRVEPAFQQVNQAISTE